MLPGSVLSTNVHVAPLLGPRRDPREPLVDRERGGVALQNNTLGLDYQDWTATATATGVTLSAPSVAPFEAFAQTKITEVALAFDPNMNYAIAYMVDGFTPFLRWWNPLVNNYVNLALPLGSYDLRLTLDDKRPTQTTVSDVILTYLRDGSLYYRQLRDRFEDEYKLADGFMSNQTISEFGMNNIWRLQWNLRWVVPRKTPHISDIRPRSTGAENIDVTVKVEGYGFREETRMFVEGQMVPSVLLDEEHISMTIPGALLESTGLDFTLSVQARTPKPGGGDSNVYEYQIRDVTQYRAMEPTYADIRALENDDLRIFDSPAFRLTEDDNFRITEDGVFLINERS